MRKSLSLCYGAVDCGLKVFGPQKGQLDSNQIISGEGMRGQFLSLENSLGTLKEKPHKIVAISSEVEDLNEIKALSENYSIDFEGYFFCHKNSISFLENEEILALELEHLDHLLTNHDADCLLVN